MAATQQQLAQQQAMKNRDFMRLGYPQTIPANAQNGTSYATGQLYNFDVPIVPGAYVERIRVKWSLNFTYTPGTGSAAVNAGAAYNMFQDVSVMFGNKQMTVHPIVAKVLAQLRGYNRGPAGSVFGTSAAGVQSLLYSQPALASGANAWKGYFDLPTTLVHPTSPYGLIPIGGSGTRMQIQLQSAPSLTGPDPLQNVFAITGNATITAVTGTVKVDIVYRDFKSFATPAALECDLTGLPTAQIIRLREMNPLTAGSPNYMSITNPYPFVKVLSFVIDGQQSDKFCAASNLQAYRIDGAENTSSTLRVYDQSTGGIENYFTRHRELYGQDTDEGVLVFDANAESVVDTSNQEGEMWLNVSSSGFPASRVGVQVGAVSSANSIVPRVVSYGVILNPVGIN